MSVRRHRCLSITLALLLLALPATAALARTFVTIGTGDTSGVYYFGGGGLCELVNEGRADHQIRCRVTSTDGSLDNITALRRGERALGFAQSDLALQAYEGRGPFADDGAFSGLRVVAAMHTETVTLVASGDSGIDHVRDLPGHRVSFGETGSGPRASTHALMDALGWVPNDFADVHALSSADQASALCNGEIDAALFIVGHPNNAVRRALECGGTLVPVDGAAIDRLVRGRPYYANTVIAGGTYDGVGRDVPSYGVETLLLSSTNAARGTIREITGALLDGLDGFRGWHRAFDDLEAEAMARGAADSGIPVHPGARAAFDGRGLD